MTVKIVSKQTTGPDPLANALGVTLCSKADIPTNQQMLVIPNSSEMVDEFQEEYLDTQDKSKIQVLKPPYNLLQLAELRHTNNALGQCVAAMEVNVDGTGCVIELPGKVGTKEEDTLADQIKEFFDEPFPGESFITQRKALRVEVEVTGNAYLEVLRTIDNTIVMTKVADSVHMRLLRLDEAVPVQKTVRRFGKDVKYTIHMQERRFVQKIGKISVFFKEFGSTRALNKHTGKWIEPGEEFLPEDRASEIIHFTGIRDPRSPYGLPRWIAQVPSILGSRQAEELNLDFFNAGGLPPALIMIQGGAMATETKKELQSYLTGKGQSKHRAAIIETYSNSGSLDGRGNVKVTVERFGAEKQKDSMFEAYDMNCEKRVRASYRLPPLFIGRSEDHTMATAVASYQVAEAQVFQPERTEFDERINNTLMREIGKGYKFRSLPLNVKDVEARLKGIELVLEKVEPVSAIKAINEITNLDLVAREGVDVPPEPKTTLLDPTTIEVVKKSDPLELLSLASDWACAAVGDKIFTSESMQSMQETIGSLQKSERELFDTYVSTTLMAGVQHDPDGAAELCGCAVDIINASKE